jgi:hypothetical protein
MTTERAFLRVTTTGAWSSQTLSMVLASRARASEKLMVSIVGNPGIKRTTPQFSGRALRGPARGMCIVK